MVKTLFAVLMLMGAGLASAQEYPVSGRSPRQHVCLNGTWQILSYPKTVPDPKLDMSLVWPPESTGGWDTIILPANLLNGGCEGSPKADQQPAWRSVGYPSGRAWFKRSFTVPAEWVGQRVLFRSGGVNYDATVYVNGKFVGRHRNQLPFVLDITEAVQFGRANEIHLGYFAPDIIRDKDGRVLEPDGDMMVYMTGPYGDLYIEPVGTVWVDNANIIAHWENRQLEVAVTLAGRTGEGKTTIEGNIYDGKHIVKPISVQEKTTWFVSWPEVKAWQPDRPQLYELELTVKVNGTVTDRWRQRFGFREFTARDGHYLLNGKRINLKVSGEGVSYSGQIFSPDYIRALFRALKSLNLNGVRLHGMPFPTVWLDVADEEGFLVVAEGMFIPGSWAPNSGERTAYDFKTRWPRFENYWREWVIRDRNHPSVVMWSAYNEPSADTPFEQVYGLIRQADRSGRPVFCDGNLDPWADVCSGHYLATPISGIAGDVRFPYWPDDLYVLDSPERMAPLFKRWTQWYVKKLPPALASNMEDRIERLRQLSAKPYGRRWVALSDRPRPLSVGEEHKTWMFTVDEFSRFLGDKAYRGVYDPETGGLWQGIGEFEANAVDAYRYMEVDHYCLPWHPGAWSLACLYRKDGGPLTKGLGTPLENTPGYHPYRIVADRPLVNPEWDPAVPEKMLTACGKMLKESYKPIRLIVRPEQQALFLAGSLSRRIAVANDTLERQVVTLTVSLAGKIVAQKKYEVAEGQSVRDQLSVPLKMVAAGRYGLQYTATAGGKIVDQIQETIHLLTPSRGPSDIKVVLYDRSGKTKQILQRLHIPAKPVSDLEAIGRPGPRQVLVIGEFALKADTPAADRIQKWVDNGGSVIVLAQVEFGDLAPLLGKHIKVLDLPNSQAFIRRDHPIVADLTDEDLRLWGEDHMVTRCSVQLDRLANAHWIADQGSHLGLVHPVIAEFFRGKGRIILLQCLCVEQFDGTPVAQKILAGTLDYCRTPLPNFSPLVVRNDPLRGTFLQMGVECRETGKVLFVTRDTPIDEKTLLDRDGPEVLWFNRPSATQMQWITRRTGKLTMKPTQVNHCQLVATGHEALTCGLTGKDLFPVYYRPLALQVVDLQNSDPGFVPVIVEPQATGLAGKFGGVVPTAIEIDRSVLQSPRKPILSPGAALVVYRKGGKSIIVDTIDWQSLLQQEPMRMTMEKILTNLKVRIDVAKKIDDQNTIGILRQEALYRIKCGQVRGKEVVRRVIRPDGMDEQQTIKVAYTDHAGNEWLVDQPYAEGKPYGYVHGRTVERAGDLEISGTLDDDLFRSELCEPSAYKFKLANGTYRLRLYLAETFEGISSPGMRVFSVKANGQMVAKDLDIFQKVGLFHALVIEKPVKVVDGVLTLEFIPKAQSPLINAIEVLLQK